MTIAKKIEKTIETSSWIRKMFEAGARLKAEHGADKVFDFSLGNPNLEPPDEFREVLRELVEDGTPGMHGYMPNAGYEDTRTAVAKRLSLEQEAPVSADQVVMTCGAAGGPANPRRKPKNRACW